MTFKKSAKRMVAAGTLACLSLVVAGVFTLHAEEMDRYAPYDRGIPEGWTVIEGDILVPVSEQLGGGVYTTSLWPGGIVPFVFDANVTQANQAFMLQAMQVWESVANVRFTPRTNETGWFHIQNSTENSSPVGYGTGSKTVNIFNWNVQFIMVHELGHALGFWHEQSREDRDTYVTIETQRIEPGQGHNFDRHDEADVYGPYDFDSVMHYGQCAFSCCDLAQPPNTCCTPGNCGCVANPANCRTITVNPPWNTVWQNAIGQRTHLSRLDGITMSFLYPEADWVFVDASNQGSSIGSFFDPYRTLAEAVYFVPVGGRVIFKYAGNYNEAGVFNKAMTWDAPLGGVVIGSP